MILVVIKLLLFLLYFTDAYQVQDIVWLNRENNTNICTGALIDIDFVLMSASCVFDNNRNQIDMNELKIVDASSKIKAAKQVFVHPKFNKVTLDNNIAIIYVEPIENVEANPSLTTLIAPLSGKECVIAGPNNEMITIKIPDEPNCAKKLMCIKVPEKCPGAGSVLKCDNEIAGIGLKCNDINNEIVFVDVSKYNNWIDEIFRNVVEQREVTTQTSPPENESQSEEEDSKELIETEEKEVTEKCKNCYDECYETWTREYFRNQLVQNIYCKRGFYPYGCVYTVKHYIIEQPQPQYFSAFDAFLSWFIHRHHDFVKGARNILNRGTSILWIY
uniref:CSON003057 protein n=1 Tax=Culicoides sonorensis TaxID=179676 RepID=A0A336L493_CULSO